MSAAGVEIYATRYDRASCQVGVVHLGLGAFHRSHQAVYIDDYIEASGDQRWGIAAVNLRSDDTAHFQAIAKDCDLHDGYFLKTYSGDGVEAIRRVRSHIAFSDWSVTPEESESLLSQPGVHLVTITVTESGYYTDHEGELNLADPTISAEVAGDSRETIYAYLRAALAKRVAGSAAPLTIACCDNIRQNGKMLRRTLLAYLRACNETDLAIWVENNVAFPCSMVDRITPRSPAELSEAFTALIGKPVASPVMAEDFTQWVLQSQAAADMPALERAGVTVTADVDPYEETKIRVLNGGHTSLAYLAALQGIKTFDAAMREPELLEHFKNFEMQEVLPAITLDLPFSKDEYLQQIIVRFGNTAIGDTVERICADGMVKFSIFIRPTLEGCLQQGIMPLYAIRSIASWYVFALHVEAGKIPFKYVEPGWNDLKAMLGTSAFATDRQLWGELPASYPDFSETLRREIVEMESRWPV
jgi:mannitol-1-phosphate/altronate dehydrogenase